MAARALSSSDTQLPFRFQPREAVLRDRPGEKPFSFSVISNEKDEHFAVVRELHEPGVAGSFSDKLQALNVLKACGVEVASHLGVRIALDKELLIVEYVDGPDFDVSPNSAHPDRILEHATGLGQYFCRAVLEEDYVLSDVMETAQYRVRDGSPVLVDLDAYLDSSFDVQPVIAEYQLDTLRNIYTPLLPEKQAQQLHESVESFKNQLLHP